MSINHNYITEYDDDRLAAAADATVGGYLAGAVPILSLGAMLWLAEFLDAQEDDKAVLEAAVHAAAVRAGLPEDIDLDTITVQGVGVKMPDGILVSNGHDVIFVPDEDVPEEALVRTYTEAPPEAA